MMCLLHHTPVLFFSVVQFLNSASSAVESGGSILFTVISLVTSDSPFSIQVCTRDSSPVSAEGLLFMNNHSCCMTLTALQDFKNY